MSVKNGKLPYIMIIIMIIMIIVCCLMVILLQNIYIRVGCFLIVFFSICWLISWYVFFVSITLFLKSARRLRLLCRTRCRNSCSRWALRRSWTCDVCPAAQFLLLAAARCFGRRRRRVPGARTSGGRRWFRRRRRPRGWSASSSGASWTRCPFRPGGSSRPASSGRGQWRGDRGGSVFFLFKYIYRFLGIFNIKLIVFYKFLAIFKDFLWYFWVISFL